jgi:hypothetical protein
MSSDVYIDFNEGKEGSDWYRIGGLGTMSYFEIDLLEQIRTLQTASKGVVTPWLPEALATIHLKFEEYAKHAKENPMETLCMNAYEWNGEDDFYSSKEIKSLFEENIGKTWDTRVD